jgi:hypothetical protein
VIKMKTLKLFPVMAFLGVAAAVTVVIFATSEVERSLLGRAIIVAVPFEAATMAVGLATFWRVPSRLLLPKRQRAMLLGGAALIVVLLHTAFRVRRFLPFDGIELFSAGFLYVAGGLALASVNLNHLPPSTYEGAVDPK